MNSNNTYTLINTISTNIFLSGSINKILPITNNTWVDDTSISNCHKCNKLFTFFVRKHHCRGCGRIFCYYCTNNYINSDICSKTKLIDKYTFLSNIESDNKQKVCIICYKLFTKLNKIKKYITLFQLLPIDIITIYKLSLVCKIWNESTLIYLFNFKDIQYILPTQTLSIHHSKLICNNFKYIIGHNKLMTQFIKLYNWNNLDTTVINNIIYNIKQSKNLNCKYLLCNKNCSSDFSDSNIIDILLNINNIQIREYIIEYLYKITDDYLYCYIPLLVDCIKLDTINNPIICNYLIGRAKNNYYIAINVYWELIYYSINNYNIDLFITYYIDKLKLYNIDLVQKIQKTYNFFNTYTNNFTTYSNNIDNILQTENIYSPFHNSEIKLNNIKYTSIIKKNSYTKPLIVPFNKNTNDEILIMYKPENLRKDKIITNIIKLIDLLLKKENLDLGIINYQVLCIGNNRGIIEIVDNSISLYEIINSRKTTILNYILENNAYDTVNNIKKRFIKSTAAYCIITFLLGIGDRHLDNIMIHNNGTLFHIDYTFLLGDDPKLYAPNIRIIPDMVDVMGGKNSYNYLEFKKICNQCFNILKDNTDIITQILYLLTLIPDTNININKLENEILKRFNPSELQKETDIQLNATIENSKESYNKFIDYFHYYSKENRFSNIFKYTKQLFE